jgi:hypothetical protein
MATAMVAGAAARLLSARPGLRASQVRATLVRTARDVGRTGRDDATGAGVLDLGPALRLPPPPPDGREPDDDPPQALAFAPLLPDGSSAAMATGRVTPWSDPRDNHTVVLDAGDTLVATVQTTGADVDLALWRPGTPAFRAGPDFARRHLVAVSIAAGARDTLRFRAPVAGRYALEVRAVAQEADYRLTVSR